MEHYRFEPSGDGVLAAVAAPSGGARANAAIVDLEGATLVFDTGLTPQAGAELRAAAERIAPVACVVNSHWHADHVRGNQAFDGVEIVATERTRELLGTGGAEQLAAQKAHDWEASLAAAQDERPSPLDRSFEARLAASRELARTIDTAELRLPTRTFRDRLELAPGCEVVSYGGGHTESDALLVLPERGVALLGDLLAVEMHPWMGAGDPVRWIEILQRVETLDVDVLVPGHGRVATRDDLRAFREHLQAFLDDPDGIERCYPEWDFWGDTADRNRAFLAAGA